MLNKYSLSAFLAFLMLVTVSCQKEEGIIPHSEDTTINSEDNSSLREGDVDSDDGKGDEGVYGAGDSGGAGSDDGTTVIGGDDNEDDDDGDSAGDDSLGSGAGDDDSSSGNGGN